MVAPRGVCALATHPEQCTHVHDAETCVGEGQQDAPGKSLEIAAKPGADVGAEFKCPAGDTKEDGSRAGGLPSEYY